MNDAPTKFNRVNGHYNPPNFATSQGRSFRHIATAPLPEFVEFLAHNVLIRFSRTGQPFRSVAAETDVQIESQQGMGQLTCGWM